MSIANITTTADNGVERITDNQQITGTGGSAGTIDGESVVLDGATSVLETGTSAGEILIDRSVITVDSDAPTVNDAGALMNYGGRAVTTTELKVRNSFILIKTLTARKNIQVTEISDSKVIEGEDSNQLFFYTRDAAVVRNVTFRGINTWELVGQPAELIGVFVDTCAAGYLNWEAGRLDFIGFNSVNGQAQDLSISSGATDNACWHWNNGAGFDNTNMLLVLSGNRYYDGRTISWRFIDRSTGSPVALCKVKVKDDFPGNGASMTERGEYLTNASGYLTGTWDSRLRATGSDIVRDALYLVENAVVRVDQGNPGAYSYPVVTYTGWEAGVGSAPRSFNYEVDAVVNKIEIKAYLYEAPTGYHQEDTLTLQQIGTVKGDFSGDEFVDFVLVPDLGITQSTIATVLAYTTLETLAKAYDRIKAEWYSNALYPPPNYADATMDLEGESLIIDGTATAAFAYTGVYPNGTITISTNTGNKSLSAGTKVQKILTTGTVTIRNGATINGITITASAVLLSDVDVTDVIINGNLNINTGLDSTLNFSNVTVTGNVFNDATANTLTINATEGSSLTAGDPGTGNGQTNIITTVPVTITVLDITTGLPIENANVLLEEDPGGTDIIKALTNASGVVTTSAYNYTADQDIVGTVRRSSPGFGTLYQQGTITGTITSTGFATTISLIPDE